MAAPPVDDSQHASGSDDQLRQARAGSDRALIQANLAAIATAVDIRDTGRTTTDADIEVLDSYRSWGGVPAVFDESDATYAAERERLRELLDEQEYAAARRSTLTAFFTGPDITTAVWSGLETAGYTSGTVLEPGAGTGNFLAQAPTGTQLVGVEVDPTSALIAAARWPEAQIRRESFTDTRLDDNTVAATVGNVPFSTTVPYDPDRNRAGLATHDYFISKSIDLTAPGGYVALVTSTYTADAREQSARDELTERADLITGVRLPSGSNGAFSDSAGTEVATDLLVFRVRDDGQEPTERTRQFRETTHITVDGEDFRVNRFLADNPDHILGRAHATTGRFGAELGIQRDTTSDLGQSLSQVINTDIAAATAQGLGQTADPHALAQAASLEATGLVDTAAEQSQQIVGTVRYDATATGHLAFEQLQQNTTLGEPAWETVTPHKKYAEQWARIIDLRDTTTALLTAYGNNTNGQGNSAHAAALRTRLNEQYDAYVEKFGPINLHEIDTPRAKNASAVDKAFTELEETWRKDNGVADRPFEGELPVEVRDELMSQARQPSRSPRPVRRHIAGALQADPLVTTVMALENYDDDSRTATKASLFTTNPLRSVAEPTQVDTLDDAVTVTRHSGRAVTAENIAELVDGYTADQVVQELEESQAAFRDPSAPAEWIPAQRYLSGPVRAKLTQAEQMAEADPRFEVNRQALADAQPEKITRGISINLGATWIPQDTYRDFIADMLEIPDARRDEISLVHAGDYWHLDVPHGWIGKDDADLTWGVCAANANGEYNYKASNPKYHSLSHHGVAHRGHSPVVFSAASALQHAMNMEPARLNFSKAAKEFLGYEKPENVTVPNPDASRAAGRKTQQVKEQFEKWATADPERHAALIDAYNLRFNNVVAPDYDGTDRAMPGLSEKFSPYPYQLNAVERMVNEHSVLLNHVVGAGKTGTMIMGAMELDRLGLVTKPLMVVPNHLVDQISREANQWYPSASVLSGSSALGGAANRQQFLAQVATHDWDLVVVPESTFKTIPLSPEVEEDYLGRRMDAQRRDLEVLKDAPGDHKKSVKDIEKSISTLEEKIKKVQDKVGTDVGLTFDQLGVDYLIADEAHGFKNLARNSPMRDLAHRGSDKAMDLDMKLEWMRMNKSHPDAPTVTFATGTPISNNIAELWVMQHHLRPDLLHDSGVSGVNAWGLNFTGQVTDVDFTAGGKVQEKTRISSYINVADLARMCTPFMDYVGRDQITAKLPELTGGNNTVIEFDPGIEVKDLNRDLLWREDQLRELDNPQIDNPLKLINDGKAATLDPRLAGLDHDPGVGRVAEISRQVHTIWDDNKDNTYLNQHGEPSPNRGALQIIFCDKGVPSSDPDKFDVYTAIRDELVDKGMDRDRIRFIHEWDDRKMELFDDCNNGNVDVLIGNTQKMGTGANIQSRAVALHHADVPWRPADLEQREGRIVRQGNQNDEVGVFNYIASGTHDGFSWGTVARKSAFIDQFYRADQSIREMEPLEGSGEALAHNKALATGNPDFIRHMELDREIENLESEKIEHEAQKASQANELATATTQLPRLQQRQHTLEQLAPQAQQWADAEPEERSWSFGGRTYTERTDATEGLTRTLADVARSRSTTYQPIGEIGGVPLQAKFSYTYSSLMLDSPVGTMTHHVPENLVRDDLVRSGEQAQNVGAKRNGVLTRLESVVKAVDAKHERCVNDIADTQRTIDRLRNTPDTGDFPRADELQELKQEYNTVAKRIAAFNESDAEKAAQRQHDERLTAKGRTPGFSLDLNPTKHMIEEGITHHPKAPPLPPPPEPDPLAGLWAWDIKDQLAGTESTPGSTPNTTGVIDHNQGPDLS